jgi:hypothetical protein
MRMAKLTGALHCLITSVTLAWAVVAGSDAQADDQVLSLLTSPEFYENYLGAPPPVVIREGAIVGAVVVGMRLTANPATFEPQSMRIVLGAQPRTFERLCVKIQSRDGRYFARGYYQVTSGSVALPLIKFHTNYQQLSRYTASDVAISATPGGNCNDAGEFFPVKHATTEEAPQLVVQVRAGDARLRAQLGHEGTLLGASTLCSSFTGGSTVGFTHECILPFQNLLTGRPNQLTIGETNSQGKIEPKTYSVRIPLSDQEQESNRQ